MPDAKPAAEATPPDAPRLSKRMSELGLCSRREADEWIEAGWVRVDGAVVNTLGARVAPQAKIEIDPAARAQQRELVTILLNKPVGYVSGQAEDGHPPASVLLRPEHRWEDDPAPVRFKPAHLRGLAPAGRLDIDSTGLLVFTQDGRIARRLIGRDSEIEKEYLVRVEGRLSEDGLRRLRHGLELDGVTLKPAQVSWQNEEQLRFALREGRKRQIRRMCEQVGLRVTGLKRVRTGGVPLGKLPPGKWRYLRRDEVF
jgi:23S rRNA pseudouridine2604 synthase